MPGSTLSEFVAVRGAHHGAQAWMESIDEDVRQQVIDGWLAGVGITVIVEWLQTECGLADASKGKVHNWLMQKHPRPVH